MLTSSSRTEGTGNAGIIIREDDVRVLTLSSRTEGTRNAGIIVREDDVRVLTSSFPVKIQLYFCACRIRFIVSVSFSGR